MIPPLPKLWLRSVYNGRGDSVRALHARELTVALEQFTAAIVQYKRELSNYANAV
jgi:hypothetical protein